MNAAHEWLSEILIIPTFLLLFLCVAVWRRFVLDGREISLEDVIPQKTGFVFSCVILVFIYVFLSIELLPQYLPPVFPGQIIVWIFYFLFFILLIFGIYYSRRYAVEEMHEMRDYKPYFSWGLAAFMCIVFEIFSIGFSFVSPFQMIVTLPVMAGGVILGIILFIFACKEAFVGFLYSIHVK